MITKKRNAICFDLDGTICDVSHRRQYVVTKPRNWDAWNNGISFDVPNPPVKFVYNSLRVSHPNVDIFIVSGRSDDYKNETIFWLNKYNFIYDGLYMRKEGDYRDDVLVKSEIVDEIEKTHNILFVFDDRPRVVKFWQSRNIWVFNCQQNFEDF
jgi:predicted secreted acid phosphatase